MRPSSASKAANVALKERGVKIVPVELLGPQENLVEALNGIDVVVSAVGPSNLYDQIPLATAAKAAGVKRFVPCGFITMAPPRGVMMLREEVSFSSWDQVSFPGQRLSTCSAKIDVDTDHLV